MRISLVIAAIVLGATFAVAIPFTPATEANGSKVDICHVNGSNDSFEFLLEAPPPLPTLKLTFVFGRVISVSPQAAEEHYAHGDSEQVFFTLSKSDREEFENENDMKLPNADCFVIIVSPAED